MKAGRIIPKRLGAKLTPEERMAERYLDQPARLLELAAETRNRALYQVARDLLRKPRRGEA